MSNNSENFNESLVISGSVSSASSSQQNTQSIHIAKNSQLLEIFESKIKFIYNNNKENPDLDNKIEDLKYFVKGIIDERIPLNYTNIITSINDKINEIKNIIVEKFK